MSGLSTKDVVENEGGGMPKTIQPGEQLLKVNKVYVKQFPFMEKDNAYFLMIDVETKPIDGFEGFFIDKDDESLGRYDGQIGQVKTNRWYYADGETKSGKAISRDNEILKQLKTLCKICGKSDWFEKVDGKYETIEEFVEAFNKAKIFGDKFYTMCIAGKEFERPNSSYIGYDLFFPKFTKGFSQFVPEGDKKLKLTVFDENEHWEKIDTSEASDDDEGADDDLGGGSGDDDFDL